MVYLASPFFNKKERSAVTLIADFLRNKGIDVYVPMEHEVPNAWDLSNEVWAKKYSTKILKQSMNVIL